MDRHSSHDFSAKWARGVLGEVVVSAKEWDRRTQSARTMLEFLERSPLKGSKIDLERTPDFGRDVNFE